MDPAKTTIYLGPPGTGKTYRLLNVMQDEMASGVDSKKIGFVAFTKKAADVAKQRAMEKFALGVDSLPYFRTLHSLAFRQLGMKRDRVMQWGHYKELGDKLGMRLRATKNVDEGSVYGMSHEERLMFIEGLSRIKEEDLKKTWSDADEIEVDWWELDRYARALRDYKRSRMVLDYTDMLTEFVAQKSACPTLDVLIVDEAQDLSPIQWHTVECLADKAKRVYFAGDDDQAIYKWAGANVDTFINLQGRVEVLDQSRRVPASIHALAESITRQIMNRRAKCYKPKDVQGAVRWYGDPEEIDLSTGEWLLLARNGYMLSQLEEMCVTNGYSFESVGKSPMQSDSLKAIKAWESLRTGRAIPVESAILVARFINIGRGINKATRETLKKLDETSFVTMEQLQADHGFTVNAVWFEALEKIPLLEKEYFRSARRRNETLMGTPRIQISTIHAAKGGEADNVMLMTDMSYRTNLEMKKNPDDECRVFYVAVTRAKENLHIVAPRTNLCFEL
jgi:DNA helicase II / ATP-dependent DNA helicase PcrA